MNALAVRVVAACLAATWLPAQAPFPVGERDVGWPNPTAAGSATLAAHVSYPATIAGPDTPVQPIANGWPIVVLLHGYAQIGSDYTVLATAWAEQGYIVIAPDTARFDFALLRDDAIAMHSAIAAANVELGGPFENALDAQRAIVAGHSMGGGVAGLVLAANPGYRAGFALAPFDPTPVVGPVIAQCAAPFGVVVGAGDPITPRALHAEPFFQTLGVPNDVKFLHNLDASCDHLNLVGLGGAPAPTVFTHTVTTGLGWFAHVLGSDLAGLGACVGPAAQTAPNVLSIDVIAGAPTLWATGTLSITQTLEVHAVVQPGIGGLGMANALAPALPTPFGDLLLDPLTATVLAVGLVGPRQTFDVTIAVPNDPQLIGLSLALQALGSTPTELLRLGSAAQWTAAP